MMKKAEVTAFLSLIFVLLVTFIGSVLDVTSLQIAKNYRRMDAERAIECMFAEYQKELLEEYDIFALDAGYESGEYSENLIHKRMEYYGMVNSESEIERIKFLSDKNGADFYGQAIQYMEHKYGIDSVREYMDLTGIFEKQQTEAKDYQEMEAENSHLLEGLFKESESQLPEEENPIAYVDALKNLSILKLVMPDGKPVSEKQISIDELPSHREVRKGYGQFQGQKEKNGVTDRLLFAEYLLEHFFSAVDESEHVLDYELEYLLAGKRSERENLKIVTGKLMAVRMIPNYAYLQGNAEKRAEAEALALTLSAVAASPQAAEAIAQGILLAWAFGESVMDLRSLLDGKKVPMLKDDGSWQLSLAGIMKLGETGKLQDGMDVEEGLAYEDYLRMLVFMEKKEEISMRCLDLIEMNLQKIQGLEFFKADLCVTKIELLCECSFRKGIRYTFPVLFEYQ